MLFMFLVISIVSAIVYLITRNIVADMTISGQWMNPHNWIGTLFILNRFFKWVAMITFVIFIVMLVV
ncbi:MAG: hypothetical protein K2I63_00285 [Helicobacter sp.]|nr:hypothetical protein [Helicobacter sp.]